MWMGYVDAGAVAGACAVHVDEKLLRVYQPDVLGGAMSLLGLITCV